MAKNPIELIMEFADIIIMVFLAYFAYKLYKLYRGVEPYDSKHKCGLDPMCILYNWKYVLGMKSFEEITWDWSSKIGF